MAYENILTETRDRVAIITINRPQRLNALNDAVADEIKAALEGYDADPGVSVVAVTLSAKAFEAGADIELTDNGLRVAKPGKFTKMVDAVEHVTFSGKRAREQGQQQHRDAHPAQLPNASKPVMSLPMMSRCTSSVPS